MNAADQELKEEEHSLLSVAYKNVVGALRKSYRELDLTEEKDFPELKSQYTQTVIAEIETQCQ